MDIRKMPMGLVLFFALAGSAVFATGVVYIYSLTVPATVTIGPAPVISAGFVVAVHTADGSPMGASIANFNFGTITYPHNPLIPSDIAVYDFDFWNVGDTAKPLYITKTTGNWDHVDMAIQTAAIVGEEFEQGTSVPAGGHLHLRISIYGNALTSTSGETNTFVLNFKSTP